jgi:chemotaxis protein methyltransferase CheR
MEKLALRESQETDGIISERNFEKLSQLIQEHSGIGMPASKRVMLEGRLRRRLRSTGIASFDDYCEFLFNEGGLEQELVHLIDVVTTNKTDFFREPRHFDFLQATALPALAATRPGTLRVWSAACSTGAEPYSVAMMLEEFCEGRSDITYSIVATDLSTEVLRTARAGIYPEDVIAPVPTRMRSKYVMPAVASNRREVRIAPRLRSRIGFARLNLMGETYPVGKPMHLIFCRNVLIYFDRQTQGKVLQRLCQCLMPGGYLFIGHAESITGFDLPLKQAANTVFRRV